MNSGADVLRKSCNGNCFALSSVMEKRIRDQKKYDEIIKHIASDAGSMFRFQPFDRLQDFVRSRLESLQERGEIFRFDIRMGQFVAETTGHSSSIPCVVISIWIKNEDKHRVYTIDQRLRVGVSRY